MIEKEKKRKEKRSIIENLMMYGKILYAPE
jgi:hypothetical protein